MFVKGSICLEQSPLRRGTIPALDAMNLKNGRFKLDVDTSMQYLARQIWFVYTYMIYVYFFGYAYTMYFLLILWKPNRESYASHYSLRLILLVAWGVILLVEVGCFGICFQCMCSLWKTFGSVAVDLFTSNHGCLLDNLCLEWWPVGEAYVMLMHYDLIPLWHPLSYGYYSDPYVIDNLPLTVCTIGTTLELTWAFIGLLFFFCFEYESGSFGFSLGI